MNMRLFTLVIHMCLLSTVGCFIPFPGRGIYLPGFGVAGALYSISCVSYDSHATTTKHAAAALTMVQKPHHDESVLAAFRPTHANCHASANRARPALLANAWRLAWVGQNGRQKDICTSSNARPLGAASLSCTKYKNSFH